MSFLAPWFLVGAAAVGLPILFHLIRRTIREKQVFSTLMFLQPSPPRITKQSRIENLLLLLLRCLLLGLLALAFARPFIQKPVGNDPSAAEPRQVAILMDVSASMQREGLWAQALQKAEGLLDQAEPADLLALYTFDKGLRGVVSLEQSKTIAPNERRNTVKTALASLKPGWGNAHLGSALIGLSEIFEGTGRQEHSGAAKRQLFLISDLAEGSHLEGLQGHEWPKDLTITPLTVKAKLPTNAGLHLMPAQGDSAESTDSQVRFRIANASESRREQFKLILQGSATNAATSLEVYVPPGQSRVVNVALSNRVSEVTLKGDDAEFDNTVRWLPQIPQSIQILYVGEDVENNPNQPAYYLQRAFSPTRLRNYTFQFHKPSDPISPEILKGVSLIFCTSGLSETLATDLRAAVESGVTLVVAPAKAEALSGLGERMGLGNLRVEEAPKRNFSLLSQIDFQHPLFSAFADSRFNDFTKLHFWKHRLITPSSLPASARVIASFDDESPALIDLPLGKGNLLIFTSGWSPADSQLALSTKFVPLLYSILDRSRPGDHVVDQFFVGDALPASLISSNQTVTVKKPDGQELRWEANRSFEQTDLPGIYTLMSSPRREIAVNLSPEESRTTPLAVDQLEKLGVPLPKEIWVVAQKGAEEQKRLLVASELENRQKLWRWLLVIGFVVLIAETWLAGRLNRPRPAAAASAA